MMFSMVSALSRTTRWGLALTVVSALTLAACSGSGSDDTVTVNGDVPIA